MVALYLLISIICVSVLYLLTIALISNLEAPSQDIKKNPEQKIKYDEMDVSFSVDGTSVSASLFLPKDGVAPFPCVVIGNGFGGTKDPGLSPYASMFQKAGIAALTFDYRNFGKSGGEPRQLINIQAQLKDWLAAINHARCLDAIDPTRIALWGSSLSGGHVVVSAARDKDISCIIAQCPSLDGKAAAEKSAKRLGAKLVLKLIMHAQRDQVRSWLGLSPHKIPLVGRPGSIAMMNTEDAYDFFNTYATEHFINEACARIILWANKYRPIKCVKKIKCPVLIQVCEKDTIADMRSTERASMILGDKAEIISYPINHFDIYVKEDFQKAVSDQIAFLKKHL